ncbi:hypothetical protein JCGZ_11169 [Jatropha curcas]|uniref:Uncharacterized protein n=1 Tax=Jatropha curcas TaxID=180498 RepID=A0A067LHH6_JATCU|nr:hypothetical protein JCGZ_11169 [Jatropha curcas]
MKWLYKIIVHYIYPKSASLTYVNQVELCIMWHIVERKPLNLCHIIFDKLQNNPKKLPYGMILTPVFEFLHINLDEHVGSFVSKLDSGSLKMKDEEEEKEKEVKAEKKEKMREEKEKEEIEKQKKVKSEAEKKKEKGKGKLEEIVKEERKSEEKDLTPVFEFLHINLDEHVGSFVSKLDSGSLKMKDEEEEKEKEVKAEKKEKLKEEKEKEEIEKQKKVKSEAEKKKEKGKGKLEEIVKEERKSEEKEEKKKLAEKAEEEEEEGTQEEELEEERKEEKEKESTVEKEETEKESTVEKEESERETGKIEEPEKTEKGKKVEEGSDTETEKVEISDEEKTTEDKTEQESELLSVQRSREIMMGRIEKELIEEHNKEIDEAIQQSQTIIEQNQSLIKTLEKMKDVNTRKLATLRVKGTTYIPSLEKPKNVKHTVGKHRTHGKKPPLHPSSKRLESPSETAPAQPLRSSKRLRTTSKPF